MRAINCANNSHNGNLRVLTKDSDLNVETLILFLFFRHFLLPPPRSVQNYSKFDNAPVLHSDSQFRAERLTIDALLKTTTVVTAHLKVYR